jgi:hypothetical protein
MPPLSENEWTMLRQTPAWTSLRDFKEEASLIGRGLYRIGAKAYALAVPITRDLLEGDPRAPFLTRIYWAPSDGAAERAALNRVDLDDGASGSPPQSLCASTGCPTYRSLLEFGRLEAKGGPTERATYASDGRFVHKVIDLGDRHFYFRKLDVDDAEVPYAIGVVLPLRP